jgi:plastocyanin
MQNLNRRYVLKASAAACAVAGSLIGQTTLAHSAPTEHKIIIKKFKFEPNSLSVHVGDTVTWINEDFVPHTATADEGDWTTKGLEQGQSETLVVTADMTLSYFCAYHTHMKAKLTIES